ncbi:DUF6476 family protein [Psychromarinibacter sp. C21-152]|uniref:DUF6476 family protein n=1 Tax=Psychromarinibacter sediminicola TaxID=3033385 RepID=A0AAE3TB02_9RHOB|nr:DUF6476 family protein [Psychromarinibacter sediminicola]MDF0603787.1 DUF6476 family protein [Psychromarinibacter sediminicola]
MDEAPEQAGDIRSLRLLQRLVTVLMLVMIAGFIVLIAFLVTRFPDGRALPALPEAIDLPDGATATAFTQGPDWYAVVTEDDRILVYDRTSAALVQTVEITAGR